MRFSRLSGNITQHKTKIINLSPQQLYVPIYIPDQVKKLWGVDKNISFAKKTNADKWI